MLCILALSPSPSRSEGNFPWPIEAERYITSTFGEPRPGRFHYGVDFTTGQTTGKPVYALGEGSITRVATSPFGYGKLLEFTLADGRLVVYAHLGAFLPAIEDSLYALRVRRHTYDVALKFRPGRFRARTGEVICWSGETGAGPPHLHVELRDANGVPLNLLDYGFAVRDTIPPEIGDVALIPLDRDSAANGSPLPVRYDPVSGEPVFLAGRIGIAAVLGDRSGPARYPLGVYQVELALDSTVVFSKRYDRIPLGQNRYGAMDYLSLERFGLHGAYSALFRRSGNRLDFYTGEGTLVIPPDAPRASHTLRITAADYAGNVATVEIPVVYGSPPDIARVSRAVPRRDSRTEPEISLRLLHDCAAVILSTPDSPAAPPRMTFSLNGGGEIPARLVPSGETSWIACIPLSGTGSRTLRVTAEGVDSAARGKTLSSSWNIHCVGTSDTASVSAPGSRFTLSPGAETLYRASPVMIDTLTVRTPPGMTPVTGVYRVTWGDDPMKGSCRAVFHLAGEPPPHSLIFVSDDGDSWQCLGEQKRGRAFTGTCKGSGLLGIFTDDREPFLAPLEPRPGSRTVSPRPVLRVRVRDDESGIGSSTAIHLFIDGRPVYGEYNPEREEIHYQVREKLSRGVHHVIAAAMDRAGNRAVRNWKFTVK